MEPKHSKHYLARIPTIALFALFALSPWLGILFFILRAIDRDAAQKEQSNADFSSSFRSTDTRTAGASAQRGFPADTKTVSGHDVPTEEQKKAKQWHKRLTSLCTVLGGLFLCSGLLTLLDAGGSILPYDLFTSAAQVLGGGGALWIGLRMERSRKLERLLDTIVGDRDNIPLEELFAAAGISAAKGRPVVENAIEHGYFGADAYIDNRTHTLIVRGAAPEPPQPTPQPQATVSEDTYTSLLRQLRQVNDAIPDPAMSAKITRLEEISARIFALAQKDPDKKAQLQKFMDYYLPTALKLLNTYAQLSAQGVQGANILEAKQGIEHSMDLLVTAFENQLDKLFQADALDITTDIAALEGMLNLDGLTGSDFSAGK